MTPHLVLSLHHLARPDSQHDNNHIKGRKALFLFYSLPRLSGHSDRIRTVTVLKKGGALRARVLRIRAEFFCLNNVVPVAGNPQSIIVIGTAIMKNIMSKIFLALGVSALVAGAVHAGTSSTEFDAVYTTLVGWAQGSLGKVAALSMILVGIVAGVVRQSLMAFVVGIAAGLGLYTAPAIVDGIVSATLPVAQAVAPLL
jgi:conjugal transfer pilus assembly protein TraA